MKRPMLISGLATVLSCALFVSTNLRVAVLFAVAGALVFILYFIKPLNLRKRIIIPAICISVIASSLSFIGYYNLKIQPLLQYNNTEASLSGTITDLPVKISESTAKLTIKTDYINNKKHSAKITLYAPLKDVAAVEPCSTISIEEAALSITLSESGRVFPSALSDGTVLEAEATELIVSDNAQKSLTYYCLVIKRTVTEKIDSFLKGNDGALLKGMLFGEKSGLNEAVLRDFRGSGIAHLLAVSGLHTSLWCGFLIAFLSLFKIKERLRSLICILFLFCFCILTGFTPSIIRASLMMGVTLLAPLFSRRQDSLNSLGLAVTLILLLNPYIITSLSFQLSATATLGVIIARYPFYPVSKAIDKIPFNPLRKILSYISSNILVSSFAGLFTLPVSAVYFGVFSLVAPLTNIICVKPAFWGMIAGLLGSLLSFIPVYDIQTLTIFIFRITSFILDGVTDLARTFGNFRYSTIPVFLPALISIGLSALLFSLCFFFFSERKRKNALFITSIITVLCVASGFFFPASRLSGEYFSLFPSGNGVALSIRSGLSYALISINPEENCLSPDNLPRATCESVEYAFISDRYNKTSVNADIFSFSPEKTVISPYSYKLLKNRKDFPENSLISRNNKYKLNDEIKLQIIDTYTSVYAIIEGRNDSVLIYDGGKEALPKLFKIYGAPRVLILTEDIPAFLPEKVDILIISADNEILLNKNLKALEEHCNKLILTTQKEVISWHF